MVMTFGVLAVCPNWFLSHTKCSEHPRAWTYVCLSVAVLPLFLKQSSPHTPIDIKKEVQATTTPCPLSLSNKKGARLPPHTNNIMPPPLYCHGRHLDLQENEASKAIMKELLENRSEGPIIIKNKKAVYSKSGALTANPLENNYKTMVVAKRFTQKKKQLKLKQAIQRNFQKYPISQCKYDPHLQKHVYVPSKWKKQVGKTEFDYARCCSDCCLRPCVTECKKVSFIECMKESFVVEPQHVSRNGRVQAIMIFKELCGPLWMDRMNISWSPTIIKVPACVIKAIPRFIEQARAELDGKTWDGSSNSRPREEEEIEDSSDQDEEDEKQQEEMEFQL